MEPQPKKKKRGLEGRENGPLNSITGQASLVEGGPGAINSLALLDCLACGLNKPIQVEESPLMEKQRNTGA